MGNNRSRTPDGELREFPQPTRPPCGLDQYTNADCPFLPTDQKRDTDHLPQPSRLDCSCADTSLLCHPTLSAPAKTPKEEADAVRELFCILVECLERLSTKSRELLLMKFFSELEKDTALEGFITERLKQSKVQAISGLLERVPPDSGGGQTKVSNGASVQLDVNEEADTMSTRAINRRTLRKPERFKVKTLDLRVEEKKK